MKQSLMGSTIVARAFDGRRRLNPYENVHFGSLDAVKCHPLGMIRFRPNEGGTVSTSLNLRLAPVSGYMRTNAYVHVHQIFVPYQAIEKMQFESYDDGGVTEMTKRRLLAGTGMTLAPTTEISGACNIKPLKVAGADRVQRSVKLGYNCAVNHLRRLAYHDATLIDSASGTIKPAILTANVLERLNAVLDPERNVDGAINLRGEIPMKGIGKLNENYSDGPVTVIETDGSSVTYDDAAEISGGGTSDDRKFYVQEDPDNPGQISVKANMDGVAELTLRDMVQSQKLDGLVRTFAGMIKADPLHGEEVVERALYGMTCDYDDNCQILFERVFELSPTHTRPMDGASFNDISANMVIDTEFATIVPRSELGGQLVTLVQVKPLETMADRPDPSQTEEWALVNRVHDETQLDEVLITRKQIESDVEIADEDTPVFWVGHNSLKFGYQVRGPNAQQTDGVEMNSSMWTYEVPTSVTPTNISYPDAGIDMYPFYNWNGGHAEYMFAQSAMISTDLAKGPTPVERIALFHDDPDLLDPDTAS